MGKIIFFDIDRTLFDADSFLNDFYSFVSRKYKLTDESTDEIKRYYKEVKSEMGYFLPSLFLDKIHNSFSHIMISDLQNIFYGEIVQKNLYEDFVVLEEISGKAKIGIFSKGDHKFQLLKLEPIKNLINENDIYILPSKIEKMDEVFSKYQDLEIFFVDDKEDVLIAAKDLSFKVFTIHMDRAKKYTKNDRIDAKVENLIQLKELINESR